MNFSRQMAGHFLDEVRHDGEVCECPVGFQHGELWIVSAGNSFVAEVTVQLEDLGEATGQKALQI